LAIIHNAFELRNAMVHDAATLRSKWHLAALIAVDLVFSAGLCLSSFTTGANFQGSPALLNSLFCILLILT
jgi:hypothetical protein